jgi:hypothetical protein
MCGGLMRKLQEKKGIWTSMLIGNEGCLVV